MTALLTATPVVRRIENAVELVSPTVDTAYVLPSASGIIGKLFTVINGGTANILVQSSTGALIATVYPAANAIVTPLQDLPTSSSHWFVVAKSYGGASGVPGRTDGSAVAAVNVGEVLTATGSGTGFNTPSVAAAIGSRPLGAGVWSVCGAINGNSSAAGNFSVGISTTSGSLGTLNINYAVTPYVGNGQSYTAPSSYIYLASTTTVYLNVLTPSSANFTPYTWGITAFRSA